MSAALCDLSALLAARSFCISGARQPEVSVAQLEGSTAIGAVSAVSVKVGVKELSLASECRMRLRATGKMEDGYLRFTFTRVSPHLQSQ